MANNWVPDLKFGQLHEKFVASLGGDTSIEVKADRMWSSTGNVFFEVECNSKVSGIMSTEATYLVYLLTKGTEQVGGYILQVKTLKTALQSLLNDGLAIRKDWSGNGGRVKGVVVSLINMAELLKRMENGK